MPRKVRKPAVLLFSDEELLSGLRRLHRRFGAVTGKRIEDDPGLPSIAFYRKRFGTLTDGYNIAGLATA